MVNAALFHDGVGGMSGLDFRIDSNVPSGDRAVPYIMVALAAPDECASVFGKHVAHLLFKLSHQAYSLSARSRWKWSVAAGCADTGEITVIRENGEEDSFTSDFYYD